jgi:hypothetical protein
MFCGHVDHLNEFCFQRKRMEKRHVDYARNFYHDEFIDFLPHFSSRAPSQFSHGPNHRSLGFGSQESGHAISSWCSSPPCKHGFPARGVYSHLSQVTLTVHTFPIVVHVPLTPMVHFLGSYG